LVSWTEIEVGRDHMELKGKHLFAKLSNVYGRKAFSDRKLGEAAGASNMSLDQA